MAKDDPVGLVRLILKNYGGRMTQDQLAAGPSHRKSSMKRSFKRWWEATKKTLKKGRSLLHSHEKNPSRSNCARQAVSRARMNSWRPFAEARQLKPQLVALDQIVKNIDAFNEPAHPVKIRHHRHRRRGERKSQRLAYRHSHSSWWMARDDEILHQGGPRFSPTEGAITLAQLLREEDRPPARNPA